MRKLTVALTENGKRIHIDNLNSRQNHEDLFCPYCKMELIPKQGNNKVWHFAHKGIECDWNNLRSEDKTTKNISLNNFAKATTNLDNYKFAKATKFICPICNNTHSLKEGHEWSKDEFICKRCYLNITPKQTKMLLDRNLLK